ncbi:MAG: M48 family metallopeptidase [Candidatus Sumerlaeia bacterium]|nr:M48 family metallopeptidase [Candidatus Sumerlaeia bacterium]
MGSDDKCTRLLEVLAGDEIDLTFDGTDAQPVRGQWRRGEGWRLSLHPCFRLASEETLRLLATHLRRPHRTTARALRSFVEAARREMPAGRRRRPRLQPLGKHFDLQVICDAVNREHFGGTLRTRISWGKTGVPRGRNRRSIVFGSYDAASDTIRIHPELDSRRTPRFFLEYIVFHELLHAVHPVRIAPDGRRLVHSPEFKAAERRYPGLDRALAHLAKWTRGERG